MKYARTYFTPDGESHVEDIEVELMPNLAGNDRPIIDMSQSTPVRALVFCRLSPGYASDWHPAPRRQFVLPLQGGMELTMSDGRVRQFGPGEMFLANDTEGKGHILRSVGPGECYYITMPQAEH